MPLEIPDNCNIIILQLIYTTVGELADVIALLLLFHEKALIDSGHLHTI